MAVAALKENVPPLAPVPRRKDAKLFPVCVLPAVGSGPEVMSELKGKVVAGVAPSFVVSSTPMNPALKTWFPRTFVKSSPTVRSSRGFLDAPPPPRPKVERSVKEMVGNTLLASKALGNPSDEGTKPFPCGSKISIQRFHPPVMLITRVGLKVLV